MVTGVEEDQTPSVPVRERRGPRFYDPHGPPTDGDFASAGRRAAVSGGGEEGGPTAGIVASSRVDGPVSSAVVEDQPDTAVSIVAASVPTIAWRYGGATARRAGALSCRQRLFSLRRVMNWTPPVLSWMFWAAPSPIVLLLWPPPVAILGLAILATTRKRS